MSAPDNEVQAARKRLEQRRDAWSLNTNAARIGVNLGDLCTILSALAIAERERDENEQAWSAAEDKLLSLHARYDELKLLYSRLQRS